MSNSGKPYQVMLKAIPSQAYNVLTLFEGVETRRHPPKTYLKQYGEGIVQGVEKSTQT